MFNKSVMLYCKKDEVSKIEKLVNKYLNKGVEIVSLTGDTVRTTFDCSIFRLNELKKDIELYNSIGIETKMIGA